MKPLSELIYKENAWSDIQAWIADSDNKVTIVANERGDGELALYRLQISNKSTMGAIALECGGLLIDRGWLRVLGSGNKELNNSLISWNEQSTSKIKYPLIGGLIVAYDVVGGFFAINNGAFDPKSHSVYYLAPDTLEWEDTEMTYTDFINWSLFGDLNLYYESFRWYGWEQDVEKLSLEEGILIYPYLWSKEGKEVNNAHKKAVTMKELWEVQNEFMNAL
ncbi:DUF2625 family protein [Paenibacillus sp. MMO-58]|uniref:DUF2625 family protein n=1 Tax=Paenibacillus sp. MMO-58 TaxID=3081290 RepID=UPI003017604B